MVGGLFEGLSRGEKEEDERQMRDGEVDTKEWLVCCRPALIDGHDFVDVRMPFTRISISRTLGCFYSCPRRLDGPNDRRIFPF